MPPASRTRRSAPATPSRSRLPPGRLIRLGGRRCQEVEKAPIFLFRSSPEAQIPPQPPSPLLFPPPRHGSIGVSLLIFHTVYEHGFRVVVSSQLHLGRGGASPHPFAGLRNLVMVAGHSICTSSSCGKVDREDSWFLELYQKHPGQAATFLAHVEAAQTLRGMLVKGIYELSGEGSTCDELEEAISDFRDEQKLPFSSSESSFKVVVDSFGRVLSLDEQNGRIQSLAHIPFKGRVNLRNPDNKFWFMDLTN